MWVVLDHEIVGVHDERCVPLFPERAEELRALGVNANLQHPWHWRTEQNVLVVVENTVEVRRYPPNEWSNAGPRVCGARAGYAGPPCPRCHSAP